MKTSKIIMLLFGAALISMPAISCFMYAAFAYTWWVPDTSNFGGRYFLLIIMHFFTAFAGLVLVVEAK